MRTIKDIITTIAETTPNWIISGYGKPFAFVDTLTLVDNTDGTITVYEQIDGDEVYVGTIGVHEFHTISA